MEKERPAPNLTKDTLFKRSSRAEDKWEQTNSVSRAMMDADENARRKKTERLRKMRLEAEGGESGREEAAPVPVRKRQAVPGAKRSLALKDE
ncbi:hypothetical protein [Oricola cellulosilytica]|uniref:Uncharacterized protein n=1 Tax=Oricola cellulosilytica TaxID=1429082 RepID=A0A4R0P543_9HYPH|nr:hypothetical protein [Oricola cellulosilytica]TCD11797.1 hypothetical protein E0D97_15770 [Oricola cellulosilytica]